MYQLSMNQFMISSSNSKVINHWLLPATNNKKKSIYVPKYHNSKRSILNLLTSSWILLSPSNCLSFACLCVIVIICLPKLVDILSLWEWSIPQMLFRIILSILSFWRQVPSEKHKYKRVFLLLLPFMLFIRMWMLISWR